MIGKALLNDGEKYEHFKETQTRQTVKRNLAVMKATMSARYLLHTGENSTHQLPNVDFPTFLDEEAPGVFDQSRIETAQRLVEKKQNGNGAEEIGDVVGRDFAHPPEDIDGETHVTTKPDQERLNDFIDSMIDSL